MKEIKIIAITHKEIEVSKIGMFHIGDEQLLDRLQELKTESNLDGLMYLSTCNRVEFLFTTEQEINANFIKEFLSNFNPSWDISTISWASNLVRIYQGIDAVNHLFKVASSIDSMIVGEREIITQVRKSYDFSKKHNLSDDTIRIIIRQTIETAKKVYTETNIATRPVSVVSLAYHQLKNKNVSLDSKILIIGAGVTNNNMSKFLKKHGFKNFHVFNRTFSKADLLAKELNGKAYTLDELNKFNEGFDVIITCTGAPNHIIDKRLYSQLLNNDFTNKVVIDLSVPTDLDPIILDQFDVTHISVSNLQVISEKNLTERAKEIIEVEEILVEKINEFKKNYKLRQIEKAMGLVPKEIKNIKKNALNNVFAKELENFDDKSKEVIFDMLNFMEKKYVSIPMLMAKKILLDESKKW